MRPLCGSLPNYYWKKLRRIKTLNDFREETAGFFQEDNGTYSSMRLMSFVALLAAVAFGVLTIVVKNPDGIYVLRLFNRGFCA